MALMHKCSDATARRVKKIMTINKKSICLIHQSMLIFYHLFQEISVSMSLPSELLNEAKQLLGLMLKEA
jgi:hypothetical protein